MYTSNSASHTAFVQASLQEGHRVGSYEYMDRVRRRLQSELPQLTTYFQSGGLVDAVLNLGLPTPIDVQVSGSNLEAAYATATQARGRDQARCPACDDVLIPQDIDAPSLRLNIDRVQASKLGLTQKEVVSNIITALTSNAMIAPSYWVDPSSGNDYLADRAVPRRCGQDAGRSQGHPDTSRQSGRIRPPGRGGEDQHGAGADRGRSLPAAPGHRPVRRPSAGGHRQADRRHREDHRADRAARRCPSQHPRHGAEHARVLLQLRPRADPLGRAGLSGAGRAVRIVPRSSADPPGDSDRAHRGARHAAGSPAPP